MSENQSEEIIDKDNHARRRDEVRGHVAARTNRKDAGAEARRKTRRLSRGRYGRPQPEHLPFPDGKRSADAGAAGFSRPTAWECDPPLDLTGQRSYFGGLSISCRLQKALLNFQRERSTFTNMSEEPEGKIRSPLRDFLDRF